MTRIEASERPFRGESGRDRPSGGVGTRQLQPRSRGPRPGSRPSCGSRRTGPDQLDDRPLREAHPLLDEGSPNMRCSRGVTSSTIFGKSTGSPGPRGSSPVGPLEKSHTGISRSVAAWKSANSLADSIQWPAYTPLPRITASYALMSCTRSAARNSTPVTFLGQRGSDGLRRFPRWRRASRPPSQGPSCSCLRPVTAATSPRRRLTALSGKSMLGPAGIGSNGRTSLFRHAIGPVLRGISLPQGLTTKKRLSRVRWRPDFARFLTRNPTTRESAAPSRLNSRCWSHQAGIRGERRNPPNAPRDPNGPTARDLWAVPRRTTRPVP